MIRTWGSPRKQCLVVICLSHVWRLESSCPILFYKQGNDCYTKFMGIFNVIFSLPIKYIPKLFIFQAQLMEIIIKMKSMIFCVLILSRFVEIYQCFKEYWWIFTEIHHIKPQKFLPLSHCCENLRFNNDKNVSASCLLHGYDDLFLIILKLSERWHHRFFSVCLSSCRHCPQNCSI